ncbi:MAG: hypothetical protein L0H73_02095 [Nitrococcus sp.]|nr:hypothetical protein [Nitrococcus sp.]
MSDREAAKLNRQLDQIEGQLPDGVSRVLRWLREPATRWMRIPIGILLIIAGIFSILPVLGLWMLPLGLLLLAQDVPFLRRPTRQALVWIQRQWIRWKRLRRRRRA